MGRLGSISWKEFEKFLLHVGCTFQRQKGSHRVYKRSDLKRPIIVPAYNSIPHFVIKNNLRLLDISNENFLNIFRSLK
jgi:predicted RNA binding protein YcfA (HicA-like mRNA interferase family)